MKHKNRLAGILLPVKSQKIYLYIFIIIYLCINTPAYSAVYTLPPDSTRALSIGDKVPDITINNIINYPKTSAKISDFKGKLLILDFWATWCSPCVAMIPKMDSLQKEFEKDLRILPVAYQTKIEIGTFLNKYAVQKKHMVSLPQVCNDTILAKAFPHTYLPHYVWVNGKGIVIAITGYSEVTQEHIRTAINDGSVKSQLKSDTHINFDNKKPLMAGNNGTDGHNLIFHSLITPYIEGLVSGYTLFPPDSAKGRRILVTNGSLQTLYTLAYLDHGYFGKNRIIYHVKDTSKIKSNLKGALIHAWRQKNAYCYDLVVPPSLNGRIFKLMQQDLDKVFSQYEVKVESKNIKCLVLKRTSTIDKLKSRGGGSLAEVTANGCKLQNTYLNQLINPLNQLFLQLSPIPVVDGTDYKDKIDLQLNANLGDVAAINLELLKYDLILSEDLREIPLLTITDREILKLDFNR